MRGMLMDDTSRGIGREDWTWSEAKEILLRLVVLFSALIASHGVTMWLHPMGAHHWFWNLALSGLVFVVVMRGLRPWMKGNRRSQNYS
jgi:hypothetical protein